jgi:hypothetical protein
MNQKRIPKKRRRILQKGPFQATAIAVIIVTFRPKKRQHLFSLLNRYLFDVSVDRWSLIVVRWSLIVVRCSLFVVRCSLVGVRCSLFVVRCSLVGVRCSLVVVGSRGFPAIPCRSVQSVVRSEVLVTRTSASDLTTEVTKRRMTNYERRRMNSHHRTMGPTYLAHKTTVLLVSHFVARTRLIMPV